MRHCSLALLAVVAGCNKPIPPAADVVRPTATSAQASANPEAPALASQVVAASAEPVATGQTAPAASVGSVTDANAFALRLFAATRSTPGNSMQSAYSVRSALAMTALGGKGATYNEMAAVLGLPRTVADITSMAQREATELTAARGNGAQLLSANNLFAERTYAFRPDFLAGTDRAFGAKVLNLDFVRAAEAGRVTINKWAAEKTAGKITELVPPQGVDAGTRLVLTNAVYFKAGWMTAFQPRDTKAEPFFDETSKSAQVPTMHRTGSMRIATAPGIKVLELPYTETNAVMDILLPDDRNGLSKLDSLLNTAALDGWFQKLASHQVVLSLPKFDFSSGAELSSSLKALGMPLAFDRNGADFTGMSDAKGEERLFLAKVFHKSFIKLDEQGTEAAAATAAVMGVRGIGAPETPIAFNADHPFAFLIRDYATGRIYFMGRVTNPAAH
jgi:serpin B